MAINFPDISPEIFAVPAFELAGMELGPLAVRWYALSYIAGIILGWWLIARIERRYRRIDAPLPDKTFEDLAVWATLGILVGGRLGFVLFYRPTEFLSHPLDILKIWQGGMSFHGGMLGATIAFYIMCWRQSVPFLPMMDRIACVAPIGLFFGRIANFVNAELYGRVTDVPWGVIFPGQYHPRHPSQIYEALGEGVLLFALLQYLLWRTNAYKRSGMLAGLFLCGYGCVRFTVEFVREPDTYIGPIGEVITMGQLLCIPMLMLGVYLISRPQKREKL